MTGLAACGSLHAMGGSPSIAEVAPEPVTPLATPSSAMKGAKGNADAPYPADFGATVKSDGTIVFPQGTLGHVKGSNMTVGNATVLTVDSDGSVKGVALKHQYKFDSQGALLDDDGHGVRIAPDGKVRGVGGEWNYAATFAWSPEGGGEWNRRAWRTLAIVALVVLENMLPQALRESSNNDGVKGKDAGADKGLTIRIPPPSEWFK
jgi:hypothetical protein